MSRYNPDIHHRRSIRLPAYDYTQVGAYFVTICTWERAWLFGEIVGGEMRLNEIGMIVADEWLKTADVRPNVTLDAFVVMPNHVHGIIVVTGVGATRRVARMDGGTDSDPGATRRVAPTETYSHQVDKPRGPAAGSIGAIVGQFKSTATKRINQYRNTPAQPVWQRGFYEHVIRNDKTLDRIREYIDQNPARWPDDPENAPA